MKAAIKSLMASAVLVAASSACGSAGKGKSKKHDASPLHVASKGPKEYFCPEDFQPQGHGPGLRCIKKMFADPIGFCENGTQVGDQCAFYHPLLHSCPPGFASGIGGHGEHVGKGKHGFSSECARIDRMPFELNCPHGREFIGGRCLGKEIVPAFDVCPVERGHKKHGNHNDYENLGALGHLGGCFTWKNVLPNLQCRDGLVLDGHRCLGQQKQPCMDGHGSALAHYDGSLDNHHYNQFEGDNYTELYGDEAYGEDWDLQEDHYYANEFHEDDAALYNSTSRRFLGKKKNRSGMLMPLPPGKTKFCMVDIVEEPQEICPVGSQTVPFSTGGKKKHNLELRNLQCLVQKEVPLVQTCPSSDFLLDSISGKCIREFYDEQLRTCPAGFVPCNANDKKHRGNHKRHTLHLDMGDCCRVSVAPPLASCPPGYEQLGHQCAIFKPKVLRCPHGYVDSEHGCMLVKEIEPKIRYTLNIVGKGQDLLHSHKKH